MRATGDGLASENAWQANSYDLFLSARTLTGSPIGKELDHADVAGGWWPCGRYWHGGTAVDLDADIRRIYGRGMTKRLVRHGDSAALILDKPILELLNVTMDTPLEITTDGRSLVISPTVSHSEDEFRTSLERINRTFAPTLTRLAE